MAKCSYATKHTGWEIRSGHQNADLPGLQTHGFIANIFADISCGLSGYEICIFICVCKICVYTLRYVYTWHDMTWDKIALHCVTFQCIYIASHYITLHWAPKKIDGSRSKNTHKNTTYFIFEAKQPRSLFGSTCLPKGQPRLLQDLLRRPGAHLLLHKTDANQCFTPRTKPGWPPMGPSWLRQPQGPQVRWESATSPAWSTPTICWTFTDCPAQ